MKHSIKFYATGLLALLMVACGNGSTADIQGTPIIQTPIPGINNYTAAADLNLAHTNDNLLNSKSNLVTFAVNNHSSYKIVYSFNSGSNQSLDVLSISQVNAAKEWCGNEQNSLTLIGPHSSQPITMDTPIAVVPNAKYQLQVKVNQTCSSEHVSYDLLVWAGSPSVDPRLAVACEGEELYKSRVLYSDDKDATATIFTNTNVITGFSSLSKNGPYLGLNNYCGERIADSAAECTTDSFSGPFDEASADPLKEGFSAICSAAKKPNLFGAFTFRYNANDNTGYILCDTNVAVQVRENFHSCHPTIADYKSYSTQR